MVHCLVSLALPSRSRLACPSFSHDIPAPKRSVNGSIFLRCKRPVSRIRHLPLHHVVAV